jgi:FlaA1/EpsC-like NDP-sugar epimerase
LLIEDPGTFIFEMGDPILLVDIARRLMNSLNLDVPILYTGMRPGEKITESLYSQAEILERTMIPKVLRIVGKMGVPIGEIDFDTIKSNDDALLKIDSLMAKMEFCDRK